MRSKHQEAHRLRLTIGDLARAAAPPGWAGITVHRAQVSRFSRTVVTYDGAEAAVREPDEVRGLDASFQRLRELSYVDGRGTWFSCELRFTPRSRSYHGHVDADAFPFPGGTDIPGLAPLQELAAFPRDAVPRWLLDALPTAVPFGLRETDRFRREPSTPEPAPVFSGELVYTPMEHMAVHGFGHGENRRVFAVVLDERTTGDGDRLCFMNRQSMTGSPYWVTRGAMRGTGGGITSYVLDDRRLVLHLTPEAADDLETETVLTVDLNLKPAETEELRVALQKIILV
ncbi:hypothetical protein [Streptosporangium sp. 'caverna']|uniref:hypothetical protein n=1 Tax=Streptosporangium sp. 'caverna' TaxID=2202249 RepID=UPI000D7E51E1|nr:hypothetical protein [Streptosporangium sp. 'caverna']AWS46300.1 hypothetical protein DKM19_38400 [Streptosporangium sp. 'caverna']